MLKTKDHVVWRKKQDLLVVLDTDSGHYYTLNPTAMDLWLGLIQDGKPLEEVLQEIRDKYADPPSLDQLQDDCRSIMDEWISNGLVSEQ